MFDYYLTYFDEYRLAIYRVCQVTKKITYQAVAYLEVYDWESSTCSFNHVTRGGDTFVRLT